MRSKTSFSKLMTAERQTMWESNGCKWAFCGRQNFQQLKVNIFTHTVHLEFNYESSFLCKFFLDDRVFFILATIYYTISLKHVPVCTPQRSSATSSDSTGLNFLHPVTTSMRLPHPVYLSPCSYHLSVFKRRAQMLLIDFMKLPLFRNQINLSPIDGKPTLPTGKELPRFIWNNK